MAEKKKRSVASRLQDGSFRPSRGHKLADAPAGLLAPANLDPPAGIALELRPYWKLCILEMNERGGLAAGDLETLTDAFAALAAARRLAARLDLALEDASTKAGDLGKLQAAISSASSQAVRLFGLFGLGAPIPRARALAQLPVKPAAPEHGSPPKATDFLKQNYKRPK